MQTTTQSTISRVFMNGNSQAVRIPQEYRLPGNRVEISRNSDGDLVLHALPADIGTALLETLGGFDAEFVSLLEEDQQSAAATQDREPL